MYLVIHISRKHERRTLYKVFLERSIDMLVAVINRQIWMADYHEKLSFCSVAFLLLARPIQSIAGGDKRSI